MVTQGSIVTPGQALINALNTAKKQAEEKQRQRQAQQSQESARATERSIEGIGTRSRGANLARVVLSSRQTPKVTPEQLRQQPTPRVSDLRKERPDEGAFHELVKGFVSGDLPPEVLADSGRPGSNVVLLKPAQAQSAARNQKELDDDLAKLERLTKALEAGQKSKGIPEQINLTTPLPGQSIALRLSGTQREILSAIRDAALGRRIKEISPKAEAQLRGQIGSILKKRMPKQEYLEMLADLGWDDVFEKEFFKGRPLDQVIAEAPKTDSGRILNKSLRTYLERRQARREELLAMGAEVGATSFLYSVNLPLKAVIGALKRSPKASGKKFVQTLTQIVKEERGSLRLPEVDQAYVNSLKRGSGRTAPTPLPLESQTLKVRVEAAPATRPAIPGKFDPATFDPFRPLAPETPDDPLRVVKRHRRLTRTIEEPPPKETPRTPAKKTGTPFRLPAKKRIRASVPARESRISPFLSEANKTETRKLTKTELADVPEIVTRPQQLPSTRTGTETGATPATKATPAEQTATPPAPEPAPEELATPEQLKTPDSPRPPKPPEEPKKPEEPGKPEKPEEPGKPGKPRLPDPEDEIEPDNRKNRIPVRVGDRYARIVAWRQGINFHVRDLITGREQVTSQQPPGLRPGVTPLQTFTILEYSNRKPIPQTFDMGIVKVSISGRSISFEKRKRFYGSDSTPDIPKSRNITQRQLDRGIL